MKGSNNNSRVAAILIGIGLTLFIFRHSLPVSLTLLPTLPMLLLAIGMLVGVLTKFRHPVSFVLIGIGSIFLFNTDLPVYGGWYIFPLVFIFSGILSRFVTKQGVGRSK